MKRFLMLVLFGSLLAGCGAQPKQPNIFENPVCEPPCWMNITPGVTTKVDALTIMTKIDAIDQPIVDPNQPFMEFDDAFHFTFYNDINRLGFVYIVNDRVSMISFTYKLDITLQRAIELFGTPQSILVEHAGEFDAVTFLNPQRGIEFGHRFHLDESSEIKPEVDITGVAFFDPKQYRLFLNSGFFSYTSVNVDEALKRMRPWEDTEASTGI